MNELQQSYQHPGALEAQLADLEKKNAHLEAELLAVRQQEAEVQAQLHPMEEVHRGHSQAKETSSKLLAELERKVQEHDSLEVAHQQLVTSHRELEGRVSAGSERGYQLEQSRQACFALQERMQHLLAEERQALEIADARNIEVSRLAGETELMQQQLMIFEEPDQEIQAKLLVTEQKHAAINGQINVVQAEIAELNRANLELQEAEIRREQFQKAQIELQEVKNIVQAQHGQLTSPGSSPPDSPQTAADIMHVEGQYQPHLAEPAQPYAVPVAASPAQPYAVPAAASRIVAPQPASRYGMRAAPKAARSPAAVKRIVPVRAPAPVPRQQAVVTETIVVEEPIVVVGEPQPVAYTQPMVVQQQPVVYAQPPPSPPSQSGRLLTRTQEQAMLDRLTKPRGRR